MSTLLALIVLVMLAAVVAAALKGRAGAAPAGVEWPFYARKPLSVPEQVLYFRLKDALPEHIVLAQVALSRLLGVKKGSNYRAWMNRINRMSADFVVCSRDATVVAVIELDDASHQRPDRRAADEKKNAALSAAGIRVQRWQAKSLPDTAAIQAAFATPRTPEPSPVRAGPVNQFADGLRPGSLTPDRFR